MFWEYIKEIADASWEFAKGGGELIEIIIFGLVFLSQNILKSMKKGELKTKNLLGKFLSINSLLTTCGGRLSYLWGFSAFTC